MIVAVLFAVLFAGTVAEAQTLEFRPAHWVEDQEVLRPRAPANDFSDMAFRSPRDGWIVGDLFVLHLRGDDLEVAFVGQGSWRPMHVLFTPDGTGWISGMRGGARGGVLLRDGGDGWAEAHPPALAPLAHRASSYSVQFFHPDDLYLSASLRADVTRSRDVSVFGWDEEWLRFDGSGWRYDAGAPLIEGRRFTGSCQLPDGTVWRVGGRRIAPGRMHALAMRQSGGDWSEVPLPAIAGNLVVLSDVTCQADGSVVVLANARSDVRATPSVGILRFTDTWESIAVPDEVAREHTALLAAPRPGELWLVAQCADIFGDCRARFWHWRDGQWSEAPPPYLPGGRRDKYFLDKLLFPSPDEGWAIATDMNGPTLRGLIFHYRDGVWRNRNWDWHFWDQPGFGLFGY